jgi:polar amino acid transport system substrate-binding protein
MRTTPGHGVGLLLAAVLAVTGCTARSSTGTAPAETAQPAASATPSAAPPVTCANAEASYPPLPSLPAPNALPAGSLEQAIRNRGRLVVGVSADTRLLGARNPFTGAIEGFDIDMARAVAKAIFGDPNKIEFKVINAAQRIPKVNAGVTGGGVDLVARAMTVTCDRWTQVAFSSVYFRAQQRVLVRSDDADRGISGIEDLARAKKKVCAPTASTSLAKLKDYPGIVPVDVAVHTDCLALFQEGQVDAITGDDAILAGFKVQDPYAVVVGAALEPEPYGLAIAKDQIAFVRFVNAVLDQVRSSGQWKASYDRWLKPGLRVDASPPAPNYGRAIP